MPTDSAPHWPRGEDEVQPQEGSLSAPGRYEIRVGGRVDLAWSEYFGGLSISHEGDDVTTLTGTIVDQAALHGLLTRIRDLGLPLLSLRRLEDHDVPER